MTSQESFWDWITYIFQLPSVVDSNKILVTVCSLWLTQNQHVMEGKQQTAQEIEIKIESFIQERSVLKERLLV